MRFFSQNLTSRQSNIALLSFNIVFLTSLSLYFFNKPLSNLHELWTSSDGIESGYLLFAAGIYFLIKNASNDHHRTNIWLLITAIPASALIILAQKLDISSVFFFVLLALLPLLIGTSGGFHQIKNALIPTLVLSMALPFWSLLMPPLQILTVKVTAYLVEISNLTAIIDGNYITIPGGVIHVAGGCSGLKFFLAAISVSFISSALGKNSLKTAFFSFLIAAGFSILGNWIRVFILVLVGYYSGMDDPLMHDHITFGWIIFGIALLPWLYLDSKLQKAPSQNIKPTQEIELPQNLSRNILFSIIFISSVFIPQYYLNNEPSTEKAKFTIPLPLPERVENWILDNRFKSGWEPNYPTADHELHNSYHLGSRTIDISILTYYSQTQGKELANTSNLIFVKDRWQTLDETLLTNPFPLRVATGRDHQGNHRVVFYWFNHGNYVANSLLKSKYYQMLSEFAGAKSAELVSISSRCISNCEEELKNPETYMLLAKSIKESLNKKI